MPVPKGMKLPHKPGCMCAFHGKHNDQKRMARQVMSQRLTIDAKHAMGLSYGDKVDL